MKSSTLTGSTLTLVLAIATGGYCIVRKQLGASEAHFVNRMEKLNRDIHTEREEDLRVLHRAEFLPSLGGLEHPFTEGQFNTALLSVHCPQINSTNAPYALLLLNKSTQLFSSANVYQDAAEGLNCYWFEPRCQQYQLRLSERALVFLQRRAILQRCYAQMVTR